MCVVNRRENRQRLSNVLLTKITNFSARLFSCSPKKHIIMYLKQNNWYSNVWKHVKNCAEPMTFEQVIYYEGDSRFYNVQPWQSDHGTVRTNERLAGISSLSLSFVSLKHQSTIILHAKMTLIHRKIIEINGMSLAVDKKLRWTSWMKCNHCIVLFLRYFSNLCIRLQYKTGPSYIVVPHRCNIA